MKHTFARLLAGFVLVLAVAAPSAFAAPATVSLRIEGPASTLFEGFVTTDVARFRFSDTPGTSYQCDGVISADPSHDNPNPSPVPTRGAAIVAAQALGLSETGTFGSLGPSFTTIGGVNVAYDPGSNRFLGEFKNGVFASVGACVDPIVTGDSVLFAYTDGSEIALSLTAPVNANVGESVPFVVRNAGNNVGQGGADVGGTTTNGDGVAFLTFSGVGRYSFKATKPGAVRSNTATICIHNGNDGNCGYPLDPRSAPVDTPVVPPVEPVAPPVAASQADTKAPIASIAALRNQQRFARGKGPRELQGSITDGGAVKSVELRLRRQTDKRCFSFDGTSERFTKIRCSRDAAWFAIGSNADWSYLLPSRLASGLYQLQVRATDAAGNQSTVQSLRFRVA